jgi:hypothetical protein
MRTVFAVSLGALALLLVGAYGLLLAVGLRLAGPSAQAATVAD